MEKRTAFPKGQEIRDELTFALRGIYAAKAHKKSTECWEGLKSASEDRGLQRRTYGALCLPCMNGQSLGGKKQHKEPVIGLKNSPHPGGWGHIER